MLQDRVDRDGSREEFAAERGPRAWNVPVTATPAIFTRTTGQADAIVGAVAVGM